MFYRCSSLVSIPDLSQWNKNKLKFILKYIKFKYILLNFKTKKYGCDF